MKKTNENKLNIFDEAIENVASFEEARAIINARLNHLCEDLAEYPENEDKLLNEICKVYEDRKSSFMDLYAGYYAPCKVSDPTYLPKGQGDMNDVMIDFSEGFDDFLKSMEEQYVNCLIRRRRATILLSRMLSIRLPYSRLMYLYYYKKKDPSEISESLFISRATFYRLKSLAINAITDMYYPPKEKIGKADSTGEQTG